MIQPRTQTATYWGSDFTLTENDIEQIVTYFVEVERPLTVAEIARKLFQLRVAAEVRQVERQLVDRIVYQPQQTYEEGAELVFPGLQFAHGRVTGVRDGYNPQFGHFPVIQVDLDGKTKEFASGYPGEHILNSEEESSPVEEMFTVDEDLLFQQFGEAVIGRLDKQLPGKDDFIRLGRQWFIKSLMAEVNVGHLHLAEAVLEMFNGGPLTTEEVLPHLDMDADVDPAVQAFSLNYHMLADQRFDEVAPAGKVTWFLERLEPDEVRKPPERLVYKPIPYDRALLSPQLLLLEQELDDEWSELESPQTVQPVVFTLLYPHRLTGTIPLSSRIRPLFPESFSPRQRVMFIDDQSGEEIEGWVVKDGRYVFGLKEWYDKHEIPIGGFVHIHPGPEPGILSLGYDRRRAQKEWVRLASTQNNQMQFELKRRSVGCGFDDLLIVGTDVVVAVDALWRRAMTNQRSLSSLLMEIFAPLATLNPQNSVHGKTLYSAVNMLRRVPPGPVFAELVRQPTFQPVGDHYWQLAKTE